MTDLNRETHLVSVDDRSFNADSEDEVQRIAPMPGRNIDEVLEKSSNSEDDIVDSLNGPFFTPHPPDLPKESSPRSPRRLKNKATRRSERRIHPKDSKESSSDEPEDKLVVRNDLFDNRTKTSKLPPLSRHGSNFNEGLVTGDKKIKHNPLLLNLKPLSPIKDQGKLLEDFKSKQSLERGRQNENIEKSSPKPLKPSEDILNTVIRRNKVAEVQVREAKQLETRERLEDVSDSTLTSVSSEDSSDIDSDSESSRTKEVFTPNLYPKKPDTPPSSHHRHTSLSLTSVRDHAESVGRHSDSEAIRQGRKARRYQNRHLWNKAGAVTLLPRVPASKARDRNSNFVKEELDKYLPERKLMIFVGTWNMYGEKQLPVFVDDFLLPECCQFMQDLYVIGTQESTPLRKEWEIKLQEALGPSHVLIYSCAFGVLHLAMYLRRELVWFCSAVEQATVATRPGHMIKTKGAVGLTLSIFGTSFLFITSHFTAHEQKWKQRIRDYRLIRRTLSLPLNFPESPNRTTDITSRFDQVFWFGDFNFRVEERQGVVEKFLKQCQDDGDPNYDELVAKDQMTKLMRKGGVFEHFKESKINFAPTYRFDINPDDPGNYSSVRVPSWTDRIVYRSAEEDQVQPLQYDSCTSFIISDHRPVYGIFEALIKPIKDRVAFTGVHFVRDVYIEANRRRTAPPRNQHQTSVCTIL